MQNKILHAASVGSLESSEVYFFIINKTTNKCNKKARAIITTTLAL